MDKDNKQITIKWTLSPVLEKSHYQTTYQILQGNSKIIDPSVTCHSSPNQLKRLALLQFSTFFEDQNLLPTYQSAYCKHHSTETAVLNICDEILENAEHNKLTAMVCLDPSAAFDTVNSFNIEICYGTLFWP